jgi:hypothetical protein
MRRLHNMNGVVCVHTHSTLTRTGTYTRTHTHTQAYNALCGEPQRLAGSTQREQRSRAYNFTTTGRKKEGESLAAKKALEATHVGAHTLS